MSTNQPKNSGTGLVYVLFSSTIAEPNINHHNFAGMSDVPYISEVFGGEELEEAKMLASALKSNPTVTKVKVVHWLEGSEPKSIDLSEC